MCKEYVLGIYVNILNLFVDGGNIWSFVGFVYFE